MIQNGFRTGSTVGFIIGIMLLAQYYVDFNFNLWKLIVPAILILIGLQIMFQNVFHKTPKYFEQNVNFNGNQGQTYTGGAKSDYSAIFASNRVNVTDTFIGTSLNAVFGGIVLDLRNAQIPGDVTINAQAIFGGIDIYVPAGVKVKVSNVPVFGGVSNKTMQSNDPSAPTIYLNSTCMFGGIDIK
jgi:predicted membrane protein